MAVIPSNPATVNVPLRTPMFAEDMDEGGALTKHMTPVWSQFLQSVAQGVTAGGALASNVTGPASGPAVIVNYPVYGGVQHWQLSVPVTLPASTVSLAAIYLYLNGPTGTSVPQQIIGGPFFGPFTAGASYTVQSVDLGPNSPTNTPENYCLVGVVNSFNVQTPSPYNTGPFTVDGYGTSGGGSLPGLVSGVTVSVKYQNTVAGDYQYQINGTFTPPSDTTFSYVNVIERLSSALNSGCTSTATTLSVPVNNFANGDTIQIDSEQMTLVSGAGTTVWTVTRHVNGTTAAIHSTGANIMDLAGNAGLWVSLGDAANTVSWTGIWANLTGSVSVNVLVYSVNSSQQQSTGYVLVTPQINSALNLSLGNAGKTINGGTTVIGAEVPNCSMTSGAAVYSLSADGVEQYNFVATGSTPADPRFANAQAIACPIAYLAGYGTVGTAIPTSTTLAPLLTIDNVLVTPWGSVASPGTCVVAADGVTVGSISFNTQPGLAGNFVLIGTVVYQVLTWDTPNSVTLIAGSAAPSGSHAFVPLECRYGMSVGDIIQIDNEQFTIGAPTAGAPWDGVLDFTSYVSGYAVSSWTLNRIVGQTYAAHTCASPKLFVDISSTAGNVDDYAGSLDPGTFQSISGPLPIGSPTAYILFLVSVSTLGVFNTWPVFAPGINGSSGETPFEIIGAVEVRTAGSLQAGRLTPTQLDGTMAIVSGKLRSLVPTGSNVVINGSFENGTLGAPPPGWSNVPGSGYVLGFSGVPNGDWYLTNGTAIVAGGQSLEITANGSVVSAGQACAPGQQWGMQCAVAAVGANSTSTCNLVLGFFNAAGTYVGGNNSTVVTASSTLGVWTRYPIVATALITFTAPANAAYVYFGVTIAGLTGGAWCVDNVTVQMLTQAAGLQLTSPLGTDPLGNSTVLNQSILTQHIANNQIIAALTAIAAISPVTGNLATGAAALNLTANSLNANVITASNGVFVQLVGGTVTAAISFTAPTIIATLGTSLIQLNVPGAAVAFRASNTANGNYVDLSNGSVVCGQTVAGTLESDANLGPTELELLTVLTTTGETGEALLTTAYLPGLGGFLYLNDSASGANFLAQATSAGSWFNARTSALDPAASIGAFAYYTGSGHSGPGFYVMTALHGWFQTLAD